MKKFRSMNIKMPETLASHILVVVFIIALLISRT